MFKTCFVKYGIGYGKSSKYLLPTIYLFLIGFHNLKTEEISFVHCNTQPI